MLGICRIPDKEEISLKLALFDKVIVVVIEIQGAARLFHVNLEGLFPWEWGKNTCVAPIETIGLQNVGCLFGCEGHASHIKVSSDELQAWNLDLWGLSVTVILWR